MILFFVVVVDVAVRIFIYFSKILKYLCDISISKTHLIILKILFYTKK